MGDKKGGDLDIPGVLVRDWLRLPANPNLITLKSQPNLGGENLSIEFRKQLT